MCKDILSRRKFLTKSCREILKPLLTAAITFVHCAVILKQRIGRSGVGKIEQSCPAYLPVNVNAIQVILLDPRRHLARNALRIGARGGWRFCTTEGRHNNLDTSVGICLFQCRTLARIHLLPYLCFISCTRRKEERESARKSQPVISVKLRAETNMTL